MDREDLLRKFINGIRREKDEEEVPELRRDMTLRGDLNLDSMDLAVLTVRLEEKFNVDIFEDGIVDTVDAVLKKLEAL